MVGGPDPAVMAAIEKGNAVVFLDVALGEGANSVDLGRIKLELFVKDVRIENVLNRITTDFNSPHRCILSCFFVCSLRRSSAQEHVKIFGSSAPASFCKMNSRQDTRIPLFIASSKIS
jgi:hypothetical protein